MSRPSGGDSAVGKKKAQLGAYLLEEKLAAIGVMTASRRLSARDVAAVDIEATIADVVAAFAADPSSLRWLGPVLAWIREHGSAVIVEKLTKLLHHRASDGTSVEYAALLARFAVAEGHKRWHSLLQFAPATPRLVGPPDLAPSLLKLRGEEDWAREAGFRVPRGSLTAEAKWTLSRAALARVNRQYRNRLVYGAQWRADIVTAVERGARTPTEASRASGASYEPCHRVFSELAAAGVLPLG